MLFQCRKHQQFRSVIDVIKSYSLFVYASSKASYMYLQLLYLAVVLTANPGALELFFNAP